MKNKIVKIAAFRVQWLIIVSIICTVIAPISRAGLAIPYAADANTLHLWLLNSTNNMVADDSQTANAQTVPLGLFLWPGPTNAVYGAANGGTAPTDFPTPVPGEFPALGNAIEFTANCAAYTPFTIATNADGTTNFFGGSTSGCTPIYTNMVNYINTNSGAFTWEAVIRPDNNPLTVNSGSIIGGDSGLTARAWQWNLNAGVFGFDDNIVVAGSVQQLLTAPLPTSGPDMPLAGAWYHVAITYTGDAPTNGDPAKVLTWYWTRLNPNYTNAHVLYVTNMPNREGGTPFVVVSGSGRAAGGGKNIWNQSAATAGFKGAMQDVRMCSVCLHADQMAFNSQLTPLPATVVLQPPATILVGEGKPLTINCGAFGDPDPAYQWFQNGTLLAGQTNGTLVITNTPFAAAGSYDCNVTNSVGGTNTTACLVTVGADVPGVYNSGVDNNNNPLDKTAPGSVDGHWLLVQSGDQYAQIPNAIIWGDALPNSEVANGPAVWIGPELYFGRGAGSAGTEDFQIHFSINQGDPATATVSGSIFTAGANGNTTLREIVNGTETDTLTSANPLTVAVPFQFTSANGLVAGSNSIDFIYNEAGSGAAAAAQIMMNGICTNALAPGLPVITNQPASQVVPYGASVSMPTETLGRPPLSYQWLSNGIPIDATANPSATTPDLTFVATNFAFSEIIGTNFTADYQLIISNDSGSVTSAVATLTITIPPLTIAAAGIPIWNPTNNETNIVVLFSKAVDPVTAANAGNYSLDNSATVSAAKVVSANEVVLTTSVLNPATTYTLTVQNVNDYVGIIMSPSPASITVGTYPTAIALWVKANTGVATNTSGVTQWNDLSGNRNNLVNSSGAPFEPQLTTNALGDTVIRFTATNETFMDAADSPSLQITNDMSIFAVMSFATLAGGTNGDIVSKTANNSIPAPYDYYANSTTVRFLRGNGITSAGVSSTALPSIGVPQLLDVVMQGTAVTQQLRGNANGGGNLYTTIADGGVGSPLYIGTRYDQANRLSGDMAELMVIGSALSTNDVASMESYLAAEHNMPIGTNSYAAITQQPVASTNVSQGSVLTIPAAASGSPAVSYQWYDTNNVPLVGQTNAFLVVTNIQNSDTYYLVVTNIYNSVVSSYVAVNVISGLNVSLGPPSITLYAGQSVTLTAVTTGTVPFYYQWNQNGSPVLNATNASYLATAVSLGSTAYSCTVTNDYNGYSNTNAGPVNLIGIAAPTNLYQATVLAGNPIAFWRLNEGPDNGSGNNGTIAYDYVGGNNGFYTNVVLGYPGFSSLASTDTAPYFGKLQTTNCFVQTFGTNVDFSSSAAEFTITLWVNGSNAVAQTANAGLVSKGYSANEEYFLDEGGTASALRWGVRTAPSGGVVSYNSTVKLINDPNWHFLAAVCDQIHTNLALYIDGQLAGQAVSAALTNGLYNHGAVNPVEIGARGTAALVGEWQFNGLIDDVAIYNYAMSPSQVIAAYDAGAKNVVFSTSPTNILFSAAGGNLTLGWPVNHFGWTLQAQTNNLSVGISTNWVNVGGSTGTNQVVIPINLTNGSVFYRLIYQQ